MLRSVITLSIKKKKKSNLQLAEYQDMEVPDTQGLLSPAQGLKDRKAGPPVSIWNQLPLKAAGQEWLQPPHLESCLAYGSKACHIASALRACLVPVPFS